MCRWTWRYRATSCGQPWCTCRRNGRWRPSWHRTGNTWTRWRSRSVGLPPKRAVVRTSYGAKMVPYVTVESPRTVSQSGGESVPITRVGAATETQSVDWQLQVIAYMLVVRPQSKRKKKTHQPSRPPGIEHAMDPVESTVPVRWCWCRNTRSRCRTWERAAHRSGSRKSSSRAAT
ncbi:hypothetical protein BC828DRAFT_393875 [Blastocladiella britannica]|nr:hypothetical protein BC828DRAFT_393875 [Blastocladiella britannica]